MTLPVFTLCELARSAALVKVDEAGLCVRAPLGSLTAANKKALKEHRVALERLISGQPCGSYRWSPREAQEAVNATVAAVAANHVIGSYDGDALRHFDDQVRAGIVA